MNKSIFNFIKLINRNIGLTNCNIGLASLNIKVISRYIGSTNMPLTTFKLPSSTQILFKKLFTQELITLSNLFSKYNYELRIAGGAVRDLLMDKLPSDIDFATTATPDEMKSMFETEQIRMIKTNGEKHGTITCRINDTENFEVTTLRVDVETDGRHAKVKFTKDWQIDAERRDLTINSMFLDLDGTVYDYFGGRDDLLNRRIIFVGDADCRIKEDYLRILRYFRFYGRLAEKRENHDEISLQAMKKNASGLEGISGERIWVELKKIIAGKFADASFQIMHDLGINRYLGFTGELNFDELNQVHGRCVALNPNPVTLITALLTSQQQLENLHKRVKMSNAELQISNFILKYRSEVAVLNKQRNNNNKSSEKSYSSDGECKLGIVKASMDNEDKIKDVESGHEFKSIPLDAINSDTDPLFELCRDLILGPTVASQNLSKTKSSVEELLKYTNSRRTLSTLATWEPPKFPVDGTRLIEMGVPKGPEFSRVLKRLRDKWKEGRYVATQEELLGYVKKEKIVKCV